jgi:sigma-B regulation protein RsbU (phosphoserine phosphatase)
VNFEEIESQYKEILSAYLNRQSEEALYKGQEFSRKLLAEKVSPEEIISVHKAMLQDLSPDIPDDILHSLDVLLEVMIGYGIAYREHQSLRHRQQEIQTEIEVAVNVQQTLLETKIPETDSVEIGAISVPAKLMSGDYYHFVHNENDSFSVAIADVIGKGIPAAMCMSMIKYAMDSLPDTRVAPSYVLGNLNRVVEQNVDASMFITMFYGMYDLTKHLFSFASAGHEPPLYYDSAADRFFELDARGLVLGIDRHATYEQYEKQIGLNDLVILFSDGVTECRTEEGFIEVDKIIDLIRSYIHLPPQAIVELVYRDLEKIQDFQLRDDFTLIILKRNV